MLIACNPGSRFEGFFRLSLENFVKFLRSALDAFSYTNIGYICHLFKKDGYIGSVVIEPFILHSYCVYCKRGALVKWLEYLTLVQKVGGSNPTQVVTGKILTIHPAVNRYIMLTCLSNLHPLAPHLFIVKLGFTGVYIFFIIFALKHRLWVLVRTTSLRQF